jgi:predicted ATPase
MYLVELEITNLRAIHNVKFNFLDANGNPRRWTVLLGENGCGKTTILKAIGLILAGSDALPRLIEGDLSAWIRNGQEQAKIRAVIQTAENERREVSIVLPRGETMSGVIKRNAKSLELLDRALAHTQRNYFIVGYGAFRRPPSDSRYRSDPSSFSQNDRASNLRTLFTTGQELIGLETWALDLDWRLEGQGREIINNALAALLPGMTVNGIDKRGRALMMNTRDGVVALRDLSEGYQAMAAWAGDMLFRLTETFQDYQNPLEARGLLLLDEMDLHLHPKWKINLVDFLNKTFPNLQIIATTHSPLSIQQCGPGELYVVRRDMYADERPVVVPFEGDPSNLRLSQLFLSPLIGLETLDSPRVADLRDRARKIELKDTALSTDEKTELTVIRSELAGTVSLAPEEIPGLSDMVARVESLSRQSTAVVDAHANGEVVLASKLASQAKPTSRNIKPIRKKPGITKIAKSIVPARTARVLSRQPQAAAAKKATKKAASKKAAVKAGNAKKTRNAAIIVKSKSNKKSSGKQGKVAKKK